MLDTKAGAYASERCANIPSVYAPVGAMHMLNQRARAEHYGANASFDQLVNPSAPPQVPSDDLITLSKWDTVRAPHIGRIWAYDAVRTPL
eukprot:7765953-Pyramimonas_sp.AAC.1